jgi:hypothetical protein
MKLALLIIITSLSALAQAPPYPQLPVVTVELCEASVVLSNELPAAVEGIKAQGCEVQIKDVGDAWAVYGVRVSVK